MDSLTLLAVVEDIRRALMGGRVRSVQPAGPHGLWMELATPTGEDSLLVSADASLPRISRGAGHPRKAGSASSIAHVARRVLPGASLQAVMHRGLDRVIVLEFAYPLPAAGTGCRVIAELFGRQPNLILVDLLTNEILEAARHVQATGGRSIGTDLPYQTPPDPVLPDPRLLGTVEAISAALIPQLAAGLTPAMALRQSLRGLTDLWAQEVVARAGNGSATDLATALVNLMQQLQNGPWQPCLLLDGAGRPKAVFPLPLRHIPGTQQQPCGPLGEAVERLASHLDHQRALARRQTRLRQLLRRLEVRLRSRRAKLAAESLEFARADTWGRMGEIMVAHQGDVPRGATEVTLPDPGSGPDATLTIPLDPAIPPLVNAERLFKRARRGRRGSLRVAARLTETEAELARVHAWAQRVAGAADLEALEAVRRELEAAPRLLTHQDRAFLGSAAAPRAEPKRPSRGKAPEGASPARSVRGRGAGFEPRRFISSDGLPILVGRNTQGNDYLTLHLARSQDLWLHVQARSGSHVIVRVPNRNGHVPRRTLLEAAQLAAYYSQARDDGKVAVDYTWRKYVRKPRKAKPGLVTISQEKTIVVAPDKSLVQKLAAGRG